jgi:hypothetical protein
MTDQELDDLWNAWALAVVLGHCWIFRFNHDGSVDVRQALMQESQ